MTREKFEQAQEIKANILKMENFILKLMTEKIKVIKLKDGTEINFLCPGKIKDIMLEHCNKRKQELLERFEEI